MALVLSLGLVHLGAVRGLERFGFGWFGGHLFSPPSLGGASLSATTPHRVSAIWGDKLT